MSKYIATVFQSRRGKKEWYWNVKARRGGKIVATSGEGFGSKAGAKKALNTALGAMSGNPEIVVEPSIAEAAKVKAKEKAAKAKAAKEKAKAKKKAKKPAAKRKTAKKKVTKRKAKLDPVPAAA